LTSQHVSFAKEKSKVATRLASSSSARASKRPRGDEDGEAADEDEPAASRPALADGVTSSGAGTTLVVSGLPAGAGQERLAELFASFPGFVEARLPPGDKGVGFVDFDDAAKADAASRAMQGFGAGEGSALTVAARAE